MKLKINERLISSFKSMNKNPDYMLEFLLNSIDVDACRNAMELVEEFKLLGTMVEIEINENNISTASQLFGDCDSSTVEKLLWVALLFPEI